MLPVNDQNKEYYYVVIFKIFNKIKSFVILSDLFKYIY